MTRTKKIFEIVLVVILACALLGSGFWLGWASGRKYPENLVVTGAANMSPANVSSTADFATFWQAWQDINDMYLRPASTTGAVKVQGAINGLITSLNDPYSEFFNPQDNLQFQQNIAGNFGGIGAELGETTSSQLVIIAPIKGTPADVAGLKTGDLILTINASSTSGISVDDAVSRIRGDIGTKVTLGILRKGWSAPQDFTITRATIAVPTVDFAMKGDVAVIGLHEFTADAATLIDGALKQASDAKAKGIILDLRGDPGGYLETAVDIAGDFLKPGASVVKEVGRSVPEQDFTANGNAAFANTPMVILIDGGSASAAEILSGALHDDRGIKLVGQKSFGKGTVQQLFPLNDGSAIKLTVAHWVLPSGRILDHDGLVPDYAVSSTTSTAPNATDTQLQKALEVIAGEIAGN